MRLKNRLLINSNKLGKLISCSIFLNITKNYLLLTILVLQNLIQVKSRFYIKISLGRHDTPLVKINNMRKD